MTAPSPQADKAGRPRQRLLLCAFGPFPGAPVNPSARVARALARLRRPALADLEIHLEILPTAWGSLARLDALLARLRPDAVLLLGVATRRHILSLETRAVRRTSDRPDVHRRHPPRAVFGRDAPAALATTADIPALMAALRRFGVTARPSRDAGRYLCNASYFLALRAARARVEDGRDPFPPVVFVHLPGREGRPAHLSPRRLILGLSALTAALVARLPAATHRR